MRWTLLVILVGLGLFIIANLYQIVVIEVQVINQEKEQQEATGTTSSSAGAAISASGGGAGGKQGSAAKAGGGKHGPPINRADFQGQSKKVPPQQSGAAAAGQRIPPPKHDGHAVAGLSCGKYGGPPDEIAAEMVYWRDIPSDSKYVSPFKSTTKDGEKYLTFEPDEGGWNNIRMGMETTVMLALSMGRTLVLPPEQNLYLLNQKGDDGKHKTVFGFGDFFHFRSIQAEHGNGAGAVRVLTFEEFLNETLGTLRSATDNYQTVVYPPDNRTHWDVVMGHNHHSSKRGGGQLLWPWMRRHMTDTAWDPDECIAYFPAKPGNNGEAGWKAFTEVEEEFKAKFKKTSWIRVQSFTGHPTPVDAPIKDRMAEMMVDRKRLCVYNTGLQQRQVVHFKGEQNTGQRMLIHFYAFLFFEDWRHDLWTKRFVRDHLRYIDEIQCAAARVVHAVREISRSRGDPTGSYDSMHIRRGDFQYKDMHMDAEFIYSNNTATWMKDNRTVFVATDEKKKDYFDPLRKHYHLVFLNDFKDALGDVNSNFYGTKHGPEQL
jgi:GDP-fucose protein O-fucosyltransferase